jgi:NTE family protein
MVHATRVALALGSGGARGYAHIGAIQVIEERGLEIVAIAGSSMGALVGGLHAAGVLQEYAEWVTGLTALDVIRLLDPSPSAPGAIRAEKIFARVRDLIGETQIEDLAIPFTAVATDLLARREVWFQRGPLTRAIRASIAIPSIITPVMLNGQLLADGGLMNPVPIAPTAAVPSDTTIAITLGAEHRGPTEHGPARETAADRPIEEWADRVRRGAARLLDRDMVRSLLSRFGNGPAQQAPDSASTPAPAAEPDFDALPSGLSKFDVMNLSLEAMQSVLTRYRLAGYPPDVVVAIPKDACRSLDFHRATDMIDLGRRLTAEALDRAGIAISEPEQAPDPTF